MMLPKRQHTFKVVIEEGPEQNRMGRSQTREFSIMIMRQDKDIRLKFYKEDKGGTEERGMDFHNSIQNFLLETNSDLKSGFHL